jgi:hypothetical protein
MITFEANYSKKLGLPGYSSHQYSVTIRTELADINQVNEQSEQIHAMLQSAVDREIQKTGYLPSSQSEAPLPANNGNGNGETNGHATHFRTNGNGYRQRQNGYRNGYQNHRTQNHQQERWQCSPKQQELIVKIVHENRLDKQHVEELSQQLFGVGVRQLNKLQASGLIDELLQQLENRPQGFNPVMAGGQR